MQCCLQATSTAAPAAIKTGQRRSQNGSRGAATTGHQSTATGGTCCSYAAQAQPASATAVFLAVPAAMPRALGSAGAARQWWTTSLPAPACSRCCQKWQWMETTQQHSCQTTPHCCWRCQHPSQQGSKGRRSAVSQARPSSSQQQKSSWRLQWRSLGMRLVSWPRWPTRQMQRWTALSWQRWRRDLRQWWWGRLRGQACGGKAAAAEAGGTSRAYPGSCNRSTASLQPTEHTGRRGSKPPAAPAWQRLAGAATG